MNDLIWGQEILSESCWSRVRPHDRGQRRCLGYGSEAPKLARSVMRNLAPEAVPFCDTTHEPA